MYHNKIIFILILLANLINSCSPTRLIHNDKEFNFRDNVTLKDSKILNNIDTYIKSENYNSDIGIIVIFSKEDIYTENVNEYYINHITMLSSIFDQPCTGHFTYKDIDIIIYSKKIGYINPVNYPKKFLNKISPKLFNDWWRIYEKCDGKFFKMDDKPMVSNHSKIFHIKDNKLNEVRYSLVSFEKICFGKKWFSYTNYVNLDNFRTLYLEDCK